MGERRGAYRVLVRKPLERPTHKWENIIRMDLTELGWGHGLDRSGSGQGQVVYAVIKNPPPVPIISH